MKTNTLPICILLVFSIGSISLLKAQDYGDKYNSVDVAVLNQITSQGGTYSVNWNDDNPRRIIYLSVSNMTGGSLNVSNCSKLYTLVCSGNQLTNLNIRGCSVLHDLYCQYNQLTNLDFSNNSEMVWFNCDNNLLNSFDISGCTILSGFSCNNNQLTSLNVSGYKALKSIDCSSNQLISLNSSDCSGLEALNCDNNELINLDVSGCSALKTLNCNDQQLTTLNVRGCSSLTSLICHNNQLTNLDVSTCYNLQELHCYYNRLTYLNTSNCIYLERLYIKGLFNESNRLTSLNVSGCTSLSSLSCSDQQLTSLDASGCSNLKNLQCYNNQLTSLNINGCSSLTSLDCSNNQLTGLDVSNFTVLEELYCNQNRLTNLNIRGCSRLLKLSCSNNLLSDSSLDSFYGLKIGCYTDIQFGNDLYLNHNLCFSEQAIRRLAENLPCLTYEEIHWDPCKNNKPFSYENYWTVSKTPGMPEHPIGVVADGCSAIKINLAQNDKSITVENVEIKLTDLNGNNIPVGQIGTSVSQATQIDLYFKNYLPDSIFYVAPDMVNYDNHYYHYYDNDWNRKVVVQIIINNYHNNRYALYDTIDIIRPPVLLIHGLNSDYTCFSQLQTQLLNSRLYKTGQAYCVDYYPTNQAAFEENSHVLPNSIKGVKRDWKEKGYAVSKLDIVGHSMGGILSRLYLQSSNYDNDIHKLITLNTPHSGSQGANLLVAFPSIREIFRLNGKAVDDLQVTSDAIRTLLNGSSIKKEKTVPSYSIVTETTVFSEAIKKLKDPLYYAISCVFLVKDPIITLEGVIALGEFNNWLHNDVYNDDNDLVVAVNSQRGGLSSSTLVDNEWHCGSPDNSIVKSKISGLLMLPSTDAAFSMQGFDPPTLNPPDFNFLGNINNNIPTKLKISVNKKDSVYFISPTNNNITAKSGDLITIEVARTANVKNLIFMAMESKDSVYLKDTTATSMSFTYHIPSTCIGTIPMYVFGADVSGGVYMDSVVVTISPNAVAQSLVITYPENSLLELSQGLKSAVRVSCLFSDKISRDITTLQDAQYSTKTGNAAVMSKGIIKGVHEGLDTLTVSYAGLNCSLPISVNQNYICTVSTSVSPNNSGVVTGGTGTYFYGDSVKVAAIPQSGYIFDYWSENGVKVSTNSNYSFEIYGNQNLVANFKSITGIENISTLDNDLISIYPNPNDGNFTINIDGDYTGEVAINIFSATGVKCDHIEFVKSGKKTTHEINSKCLEKGIYFIKILLGEDRVTKKIIIN